MILQCQNRDHFKFWLACSASLARAGPRSLGVYGPISDALTSAATHRPASTTPKSYNSFNPIHITGPSWQRVDINDTRVDLGLETAAPDESEVNSYIGSAYGVVLIIAPATPEAIDETARFSLDALDTAPDNTKGGLLGRVVITKGFEVPCDISPDNGHMAVEDLNADERSQMEEESRGCAEPSYQLARKSGVEPYNVCPMAGGGAREVIDGLVLQVLKEKKAAAEVLEASVVVTEDNSRRKAKEKRAGLYTARLKSYLFGAVRWGGKGS